ncbi:MAG: helix-turn-helix domain-containing protein, partial [Actinomycetospora chiangmaiensis]|nr:helix-turn-helix domain-containing protein [Actinomycetospora chiangmaiensis]
MEADAGLRAGSDVAEPDIVEPDLAGTGPKEDRHFVTALARGLSVLACFGPGRTSLANHDIAEACGLPRSTVSRLTYT